MPCRLGFGGYRDGGSVDAGDVPRGAELVPRENGQTLLVAATVCGIGCGRW